MKLYGGDNTMIDNCHLNSFITSVMQDLVPDTETLYRFSKN
ncbi:MAG: hypothetical protein PUI17_06985 [Prevotellaceae bacterium]|nr:hypothetical protein [Prevotellaceae bacterium]